MSIQGAAWQVLLVEDRDGWTDLGRVTSLAQLGELLGPWESTVDANTWEPGVSGWPEVTT